MIQNHQIRILGPGMPAIFIDGYCGRSEVRISKRTHGDGPEFLQARHFPKNRGAALRAKVKGHDLARITGAAVNLGLPLQPYILARPT